jgi:hypothetical protein
MFKVQAQGTAENIACSGYHNPCAGMADIRTDWGWVSSEQVSQASMLCSQPFSTSTKAC